MKIKVVGNAIEEPEIKFVSLVKRGANREPFKIVKSEHPTWDSLREKVAKLFGLEKGLVEKVEGSTVNAEQGASGTPGEDMKGKLIEAQAGDLDGLLIQKEEDGKCKDCGADKEGGVCKACAEKMKKADAELAAAAEAQKSEEAKAAADKVAEAALEKKAEPEVLIAKAGDKEYEYTMSPEGVPQFVKWIEKTGGEADGTNTGGAADGNEVPMDAEQKRLLAEAKAREKAHAADAGGGAPAIAKQEPDPMIAIMAKSLEAMTALMTQNAARLEAIEKAQQEKTSVAKSESGKKSVVRVLDGDIDETFATPGMAYSRGGIKKADGGRDVWKGLIPDFDDLQNGSTL